jgi:hypothetical protein
LRKFYFSSHKLPKQQSTNFWSQGILGVKEHLTLIEGLEGNKSYNRQSLQLKNNGFWV